MDSSRSRVGSARAFIVVASCSASSAVSGSRRSGVQQAPAVTSVTLEHGGHTSTIVDIDRCRYVGAESGIDVHRYLLEDAVTLLDLTPRVVENDRLATLPVAIIGAGPIGLAAAAHLVERGIDFVVFEAGDEVAASVRRGATRGCSRRGSTSSTRRRVACSRSRAGSSPTRSARRPAPSWSRSTSAPLAELEPIASRAPARRRGDRRDARGHGPHPHAGRDSPLRSRCGSAPQTGRSRTSPRAP